MIKNLNPTKIVGVGLSYRISYPNGDYPTEPILFLKGTNTLIENEEDVIYPPNVKRVWMEGELAIIIDMKAKNIDERKAHLYIKGYTIANDITAENLYYRDHHLARSKSFDTFCPIGPEIVTDINPDILQYTSFLNDKLVQKGNTNGNIFKVSELVSMISKVMTLYPDDIILTGTHPLGVMEKGIIHKGDVMKIDFKEIGILKNRVIGGE